jgi:hypothetical protein
MNFADTNWLEALYIEPDPHDLRATRRREIVDHFMRRHGGQLVLSHIVLLETRNVFSRSTGQREPPEWQRFEADFDGRIYVDSMNWDLLRRECNTLFGRYAWKASVGSFDTAIVASIKLAGGTRFLSFDTAARALAKAEGINVFPPLDAGGKKLLTELKGQR